MEAAESTITEGTEYPREAPRRKPVPGTCSTCTHPERARIEMLRCNGVSLNILPSGSVSRATRSFAIFENTFRTQARRAELLAGPARVEQLANAAADESRSLLDYLAITRSVLFSQFLSCAEAGDRAGVAFIAGKLLDALREHGRVTGELRQLSGISITNNVLNISSSPSFLALQDGLLKIARAHPDARSEIVKLLRAVEAGEAPAPPDTPPMIKGEVAHVAT